MKHNSRADKALWIGLCMFIVGLVSLIPSAAINSDPAANPLVIATAGLTVAGLVTTVATLLIETFLDTWGYKH